MPYPTYNGREVSHVIALTTITQGGVSLVEGERYGIDHFFEVNLNWWQLALDNGYVRIMHPEEYPEPQFPPGKLPNGRVFPKHRYLLINTTTVTIQQIRNLYKQKEVFGQPILNQMPDGKSRRLIFAVKIPRDSEGTLLVPNWITNNADKIIANGDSDQLAAFLADNDTYHFLHDIDRSELTIVCSDGEITGDQV